MKRAMWLLIVCLSGLAIRSVGEPAPTISPVEWEKIQKAEEADKRRMERICAELATLGEHPWAGVYSCGDGMGMRVWVGLAPQAGFHYQWHGCLGLYDRDFGSISQSGDRLLLKSEYPDRGKGYGIVRKEMILVPWGERLYLVSGEEMIDFCNEVHRGSEPRDAWRGFHLLRSGDLAKPAPGFPKVPAEFQSYLLKEFITAQITTIDSVTTHPSDDEFPVTTTNVTVGAGKSSGLLPGMVMFVVGEGLVLERVKITQVTDSEAHGTIQGMGKYQTEVKVGWRLSTKRGWWGKSIPDTLKTEDPPSSP